MILTAPLAALGRATLALLAMIGQVTLFAASALSHILRPPFYGREFASALLNVGWLSLPVVGLTAIFTGARAGPANLRRRLALLGRGPWLPQIVAIGMVRELGPVLVGLMVAARVTSSIAAEIATMKVTEQIDALVTLSTHPMKYLTAPRVLAALLVVPLLVGRRRYHRRLWRLPRRHRPRSAFNPATYITNTWNFLENSDIISSLIKGSVLRLLSPPPWAATTV